MHPVKIKRIKKISSRDLARLLLSTDPWVKLGFTKKEMPRLAKSVSRADLFVPVNGTQVLGLAVLRSGFLGGYYLNILVVDGALRGQGVGEKLVKICEEYVFEKKRAKNFYICVSSFNKAGQRFYKRLGYKKVGLLKGLIVREHDEILLRKTRGAMRG